ncbi:MutS-related protein [Clostridium cellulovorans]|uniref:MutS-related protein n=1 Tax=Clostridium cellulovorans TaxID=1493 RepID=UPI0001A969C5|nr:DNA mismatch repair protein MutS [Clostridium cellulovorans]
MRNISSAFIDPNIANDFAIVTDYIKMFFLVDVKNFEKINRILANNKKDFKLIYEFVEETDGFIPVASYRKSLDYYTKPIFENNHKRKHLDFKDIYHAIIKDPIANSCEIYKSILLTGSNASGKSTFLKTVAINSILAQTIYTCLARDYKSCYFKTYTYMALRDDIISNDSYYIVEIKSLKRIIENVNSSIPCLCFIDEILRGTNTVERIAASSEVLNYIAKCNSLCISATHDLELTSILHGVYENYHFQENVDNGEITFDYKLYEGKSETRNAIKLLNIMGYSDDIVSRAESRATEFVENGVWKVV